MRPRVHFFASLPSCSDYKCAGRVRQTHQSPPVLRHGHLQPAHGHLQGTPGRRPSRPGRRDAHFGLLLEGHDAGIFRRRDAVHVRQRRRSGLHQVQVYDLPGFGAQQGVVPGKQRRPSALLPGKARISGIFQLTDNVEVTRNSFRANEVSARGEGSLDENVEDYLKSHDVTVRLPIVGSAVMIGARNLDSDELDLKLKFSDSEEEITESRHKSKPFSSIPFCLFLQHNVLVSERKSKLKKIIVPILVFVLLKAITLIPLALGVLGLKAWNALQLSFFSFVISIALAIFQLCKKIAADGTPPQIASHGPWEYAARSFVEAVTQGAQAADAQQLAYSAYA